MSDFDSMTEDTDNIIASVVSTVAIIAGLTLIILGKFSLTYLLITFGIRKSSNDDDPANAYKWSAMSKDTAKWLVIFYIIILFGSMIGNAVTPGWIELLKVWPAK